MACEICGEKADPTIFCKGDVRERMERDGLCFGCAFWDLRVEQYERDPTDRFVIDGTFYSVGIEPTPERRRNPLMLGFGGGRFDIERPDGSRVVSHNLWCGGKIPARLRERMPDNAKFATPPEPGA